MCKLFLYMAPIKTVVIVAEFLHYLIIKDNGLFSQPLFHQCLHVITNFDSPCYNKATDLNTTSWYFKIQHFTLKFMATLLKLAKFILKAVTPATLQTRCSTCGRRLILICSISSWYISYCTLYCSHNTISHSRVDTAQRYFHFLKEVISHMDSYLVSLAHVPELPNSIFWTNQSCWQCESECYQVGQQVLTPGMSLL
jgi:hypothetical protein